MSTHVNGLQISRYADGELSAQEAERLEEHVSLCARCRALLHREFALAADLRLQFAAPAPAVLAAPVRRPVLPLRFAAAAAAAVVLGIVVFPRLTSELPLPSAHATSVTPFAVGVHVADAPNWASLTTLRGFVVAQAHGELTLRVGLKQVLIHLYQGVSAAQYPVGAAVIVHGLPRADGSIDAVEIQGINP